MSDGQFFPSARQGEAMNMINAKYGNGSGLKAYTDVNDQFAPFASQTIPARSAKHRASSTAY
jgi:TnpA family transposase